MVEFTLTAHAQVVIATRNISIKWIKNVLENPSRIDEHSTDPELMHSMARVPEYGNRVLRVVHSRAEPKRIITAYFDRTMKDTL